MLKFFRRLSIRLLLLTLAIFFTTLSAQPLQSDDKDYSLRIGGGYSDFNDLGEILAWNFNHYEGDTYVINIDAGWRFVENMSDLPFDWYLKGGFSYFNENDLQNDILEGTIYVKVIYKLDFLKNRIRFGFGEGLSLASDVPIVEIADAADSDKETATLLNYLDISVDLDLGRLAGVESMYDLYLGYTIKHRSGVAGLFSGVTGGSNYNMVTLEKNF